jgi:uncharacterized domain 1
MPKTMIWKRSITLDKLNEMFADSLVGHLGIVLTKLGDDELEATMPVDVHTRQPMGLLHGGAAAALVETLGSVAAYLCTEGDAQVAGLELNISHMQAAKNGVVRGVCRPLRIGRRHQVWEVRIFSQENELCYVGRLATVVMAG